MVINAPATADCNLVAGRGAWAEKCRTAVWVKEFVTAAARLMAVVWEDDFKCCRGMTVRIDRDLREREEEDSNR